MAKRTEISAAEAFKAFKGRGVKVRTAKAVTVKGEDGKERPGYETEEAALAESHIIGAAQYDDGRVTIVTLDGRRHEARA
jgi:hypothetical protein